MNALNNDRGVTYLFLMFAIVLIGIAMSTAARQWKGMVQRELEADLLTKGIEIQNALALYSATMKAGRVVPGEVYPQSLAELTRLPKPYLRKAYLDPITHGDWEYLRGPSGGIMGVRSKSRGEPFRKHEFPPAVRHFDGRKQYRDWIFQHPNPSTVSLVPTLRTPAQPGPNQPGAGPGPSGTLPAQTQDQTGTTTPVGIPATIDPSSAQASDPPSNSQVP